MSMDSVNSAEALATATRAGQPRPPAEALKRGQAAESAQSAQSAESAKSESFQPFGADGLTFADLLDVINPLQHIPLVSTVYRQLTGDEIDPASRVAGGTLFGGLIGAAVSVFNVLLKELTGRDAGEHMLALFSGDEEESSLVAGREEAESKVEIAWNGDRVLPDRAEIPAAGEAVDIAWNGDRVGPELAAPAMAMSESPPIRPGGSGPAEAPRRADVFAAVRHGRGEDGLRKAAVLGATAAEGGWFSATMLAALARYEHGAKLAVAPTPARVDFLN